ncbi:MAG: 50S ribosomal protein L22 [Parcubacteria group bacterium]|nr:50S ribosomal protein L22 [Parcubacteria group bacterium]
MVDVIAHARSVRISAKKIRPIVDSIRGRDTESARAQLEMTPRKGSRFLLDLIQSATSDAHHNFGLSKDNLFIKKIYVNDGSQMKRMSQRARGSAYIVRKRLCHLTIILDTIKDEKIVKRTQKIEEAKVIVPETKRVEQSAQQQEQKIESQTVKEVKKEKEIFDARRAASGKHVQNIDTLHTKSKGGLMKRLFHRKTG